MTMLRYAIQIYPPTDEKNQLDFAYLESNDILFPNPVCKGDYVNIMGIDLGRVFNVAHYLKRTSKVRASSVLEIRADKGLLKDTTKRNKLEDLFIEVG